MSAAPHPFVVSTAVSAFTHVMKAASHIEHAIDWSEDNGRLLAHPQSLGHLRSAIANLQEALRDAEAAEDLRQQLERRQ